jgi:beta-glucosidase
MEILIISLVIVSLAIIYFGLVIALREPNLNLKFDFSKLRKAPWRFGKDFLWGTATASHQIEGGCDNNNWFAFESAVDEQGKPRIKDAQKAGACCNGWGLYKEDTRLMKDLALNAYRFSVEWSKIEPKQGEFDEGALDHYEKVVDELLANGIQPMVTLHHFTNPLWFEEQGAFFQDNSPEVFTRFVDRVVKRLGAKVKLWCTINEPAIYAVFGYFTAEFPPAETNAAKAARVLRNMLLAHTAAYKSIKKARPEAQVGLVVHVALFDPPNPWNLVDVLIARMLNQNMNNSHFQYLTRGKFNFSIPGMVNESYSGGEKDAFDFIGLNYYTNHFRLFKPLGKEQFIEITRAPAERLTDMGWAIYPEGLYRSLKVIKGFTSKPIYIAENGIADAADTKRANYIEEHLLALNKAIADGIDVRGYFYWTFMDNFEWAHGFNSRFGLYKVDLATQKRTLYEGSRKYLEIIQASRK